jgi:hypothetical protein
MAEEAFYQARTHEPSWIPGWVGAALVAEKMSNPSARDLYLHCANQDCHEVGYKGFAASAYSSFRQSLSPNDFHVLYQAICCLETCLQRDNTDAWAWNLHGLLLELVGLNQSCYSSFTRARSLLEGFYIANITCIPAKFFLQTALNTAASLLSTCHVFS